MLDMEIKDVRVGDLVRRVEGAVFTRVTAVREGVVLRETYGPCPLYEIAEVVRPAGPRPKRKIKRSELIAWFYAQSLASAWRITDGGVGVTCVSGDAYAPTIYAAIIKLRAELRKKGKLT